MMLASHERSDGSSMPFRPPANASLKVAEAGVAVDVVTADAPGAAGLGAGALMTSFARMTRAAPGKLSDAASPILIAHVTTMDSRIATATPPPRD